MGEFIDYFAYGRNLDHRELEKRDIEFEDRKHAVLGGYQLVFDRPDSHDPNTGHANIKKKTESRVEGALYSIDEDDLNKLDRYMECPFTNFKNVVRVKMENGESVNAFTYVARSDKTCKGLRPSKKELEHYLKAKDILSSDYCEKLRNIKTLD